MRTKKSRFAGIVLVLGLIFSSPAPVSAPAIAEVPVTTTTLITLAEQKAWNKVAWCETHGDWDMHGVTFSGALGISNVVWLEYGGRDFAPHAGLATPQEQMVIAKRINGDYVPDQNGCNGAW
jgi:hypothetical protein